MGELLGGQGAPWSQCFGVGATTIQTWMTDGCSGICFPFTEETEPKLRPPHIRPRLPNLSHYIHPPEFARTMESLPLGCGCHSAVPHPPWARAPPSPAPTQPQGVLLLKGLPFLTVRC